MKASVITALNMDLKSKISSTTHILSSINIVILCLLSFFVLKCTGVFVRFILAKYTIFTFNNDPFFNLASDVYSCLYLYLSFVINLFLTITNIQRLNAVITNKYLRFFVIFGFIIFNICSFILFFILTFVLNIIFMLILSCFKDKNISEIQASSSFANAFMLNFDTKIKPRFFIFFNFFAILLILITLIEKKYGFAIFMLSSHLFVVFTPFLYCEIFYIFNDFSKLNKRFFRFVFVISIFSYYISFITLDRIGLFYDIVNAIAVFSFLFLYFIACIYVIIALYCKKYNY